MKYLKQLIVLLWATCYAPRCYAQNSDSSKTFQHFSGTASITNNGVSLVPSFSLGKPAIIFLLSFGGQRFSVDPDIRFGLDGRPWTFLFWARYKLKTQGRFKVGTGVHLGLNHRKATLLTGTETSDGLAVRRYLAAEIVPTYRLGRNVSIGSYYLYSHGLDAGTIKNGHFVTLNSSFSHITLTQKFYLRFNPQVFYLKQDTRHGYYANGLLTLAKNEFPLSVSFLANKKLGGTIQGSDFISSLSLIYAFSRNYTPRPPLL